MLIKAAMLWAVELACVLTIVTEMRSDLKYAKLLSSFATFLGNAIINFLIKSTGLKVRGHLVVLATIRRLFVAKFVYRFSYVDSLEVLVAPMVQ